MPDLVVSVNHVAALRQGHNDKHPDPAAAAVLAELAGAVGIAVRFTGDRRYVNDRDIRVLREIVKGRFILGMAPTSEMMGMALDVKPDEVILIPEHPEEATPSGGLDLILDRAEINDTIATIRDSGIPVFLLIDPDPDHIKIAHRLNVDGVQIHTAAYAGDALPSTRKRLLARLVDAAKIAEEEHGLDVEVIDLRTLSPLDMETIATSVKKTNRLVVVEEAWPFGNVATEITYQVQDKEFDYLDAPIKRVAAGDFPIPFSPPLEDFVLPKVSDVIEATREVTYR